MCDTPFCLDNYTTDYAYASYKLFFFVVLTNNRLAYCKINLFNDNSKLSYDNMKDKFNF